MAHRNIGCEKYLTGCESLMRIAVMSNGDLRSVETSTEILIRLSINIGGKCYRELAMQT